MSNNVEKFTFFSVDQIFWTIFLTFISVRQRPLFDSKAHFFTLIFNVADYLAPPKNAEKCALFHIIFQQCTFFGAIIALFCQKNKGNPTAAATTKNNSHFLTFFSNNVK